MFQWLKLRLDDVLMLTEHLILILTFFQLKVTKKSLLLGALQHINSEIINIRGALDALWHYQRCLVLSTIMKTKSRYQVASAFIFGMNLGLFKKLSERRNFPKSVDMLCGSQPSSPYICGLVIRGGPKTFFLGPKPQPQPNSKSLGVMPKPKVLNSDPYHRFQICPKGGVDI